MKTTTEHKSRLVRGQMYSTREFMELGGIIAPGVDPAEAEIRRLVAERFGARLATAERELEDAITAHELAVENFFVARAAQQHVREDSERHLAEARLADAEAAKRRAREREGLARVQVTTIGQEMNVLRRDLRAAQGGR